jgi:3-isopropylmalate dehydrogenase
MSASTINLAVIPGDGIGPEVIAEALKVLEKAVAAEGVDLEQHHYKLGAEHWRMKSWQTCGRGTRFFLGQ